MVLNLTKRQIMTFRAEMYAFFNKNGPTTKRYIFTLAKLNAFTNYDLRKYIFYFYMVSCRVT